MRIPLLAAVLLLSARIPAAQLDLLSEFQRVDPAGTVLEADRAPANAGPLTLRGARAGYVSFRLVVKLARPGSYSLDLRWNDPGLETDLFREWFHLTEPEKRYYPDALAPVRMPYRSELPEPDNRIARQSAQSFWVDIWIPASARPGRYRGVARLEADGGAITRPLDLTVLAAVVPEAEAVTMDHNSYGSSWIGSLYPAARARGGDGFFESDEFFSLIHAYHRIFHEHLGVFHQLGYGHGGKVGPEFAPELEGTGRNKRVRNWRLYDRHYGPLLDGSAFAGARRGARPIPFVYLPINPEWPASFLWWGEPGYEAEFVNVVAEMERHFREKGWTNTVFEMFFNHKKRYKAFPWDGDETRFPEDNKYFHEYARLLKKAVPAGTPVRFRFRSDSSWMMERQFQELAGVVDFWVLGSSMVSWYRDAPGMLKQRGDIVWIYGSTPTAQKSLAAVTFAPFQCWMWGADGYVRWLTTSPGEDPWFGFEGGDTVLAYPGERFGVNGPIPSIRLKIQRNAVQDLTLLASFAGSRGLEALREESSRRYVGASANDWWQPRPAIADSPAYEMTNATIGENTTVIRQLEQRVQAGSWTEVRNWILRTAEEGR